MQLPGIATLNRWRAALASLTLAELSTDMTLPLALATIGVAVLLQFLLANLIVMLVVGLGTVLFYVLLLLIGIGLLAALVRYMREHK